MAKQAVETVIDEAYALQIELSAQVLDGLDGAKTNGADPVGAWAETRAAALAAAETLAAELRSAAARTWRCWSSPLANCGRRSVEPLDPLCPVCASYSTLIRFCQVKNCWFGKWQEKELDRA